MDETRETNSPYMLAEFVYPYFSMYIVYTTLI